MYAQGYYRRGDAYFALGKFKNALKDFRNAARIAPRDPDLRKKLTSCEKEVKRIRFEEALATPVSFSLVLHILQQLVRKQSLLKSSWM